MCGINGFNFVNKKTIRLMNGSLSHRGPDDEGEFFDEECGVSLGQRRLSIIDLSKNGSQPMTYSHNGNRAIITFNGEIYNFKEIKEKLEKKGHEFNSNSDTEVILASYLEWGKDCVKKFNGMWAFCIFDIENKVLFLSRDRVGKKPLYYYFDGNRFIFSSEIKGILKHHVKLDLDKEAVDLYFSLGFIPAPYSIYKDIRKLDQRESLVFDLASKKIEKSYYYEWPRFRPDENKDKLRKEFDNLMKSSVKLRMISDVPLGAYLSGGLDSSTVVNYAKKFNDKINTYSIGFDGELDETPRINILKEHFGTSHHHRYFREGDFQKMLKDIWKFYDEPFSDYSMFPSRMLSGFAREKLTVALSGDGGDEIFGGYPRYKMAYQMEILRKIPRAFRKFLMLLPFEKLREGVRLSLLSKNTFYSEARKDYYKPKIVQKILKDKLDRCLEKTGGNLVEAVRLMDIEFYTLPDNFLAKVDRASMANSLEVRCPFLDYRLIEYSMKLPTSYRVSFFGEKEFFREIVSGFLPKEIVGMKKQGFTPPIGKWMEKGHYKKELDTILNELFDKKIISKGWYDFYRKEIFSGNSVVQNNYKVRLYLFYGWAKYWRIV